MRARWIAVMGLSISAAACADRTVVSAGCTLSTTLDPPTITVSRGAKATVRAQVTGSCGNASLAIVWTTSDDNVAFIEQVYDSAGFVVALVTGVAPGKAMISAALRDDPSLRAGTSVVVEPSSIAAIYGLDSVDGIRLPCCAQTDSAGGVTTIRSGSLVLGPAPSDDWVFTPAGWMAKSCVHEIPTGAVVDSAGVVHLPDGTSYTIPVCGNGPYTLSFALGTQAPDGSWTTTFRTVSGKYVWGGERMALVGTRSTRGYTGEIAIGTSPPLTRITIRESTGVLPDPATTTHAYMFTWVTP